MASHRQVAHAWAHQTGTHSTGHHMFYNGATIYSYGYHFPIARLTTVKGEEIVLFTTRDYSQSTSQHKSIVSNAISHKRVVLVHNPSERPNARDYDNLVTEARDALEKMKRARTRKDWHLTTAERCLARATELADLFDLDRPPIALADLGTDQAEAIREIAAARAREAERERVRDAERYARQAEEREKWLAGDTTVRWYGPGEDGRTVLLRVMGNVLETSQGASVPLPHAILAFRRAEKCRTEAKAWVRNGKAIHVGHFTVDAIDVEGNITAGCHWIAWSESERIARALGLMGDTNVVSIAQRRA